MTASPIPNAFWPSPDPRVAPYALSRASRSSELSTRTFHGPPATFAFRTSQGQIGLLQIVEVTPHPQPALRIRYRFLTTPADPPRPRCRATVTPVANAGPTYPSGSAPQRWNVTSTGKVSMVLGWAVLEGGLVTEVSGRDVVTVAPWPGNAVPFAARPGMPMPPGSATLGFSATPVGGNLNLSRDVNSGLGGARRTSSRTNVPPGTTLKTSSLSRPAQLTDAANLTLWRGDFVDGDGRIVKSVIFAARLLTPGDLDKSFRWPYAPPPKLPGAR